MSNEINNNDNYESKYIKSLLEINKSLRNEVETIYKLLRQKLKLEFPTNSISSSNNSNNNPIIKLNNLINEFEIILSNLGIQMESHNELISTLNTIEEKFSTIQKNTILLNNINDLQKKLKMLISQNNDLKQKFENVKKTNDFLNKENIDLRLQLERSLKEKKDMVGIISQIENMGDKLKDVEKKYKEKLIQKDNIISQLDVQLQQYELKIKQLQKELLLSKIEVEKNKVEILKDKNMNNKEDNNILNLNTNNTTYMNSDNKILNSIINGGLNFSNSIKSKKLDENKKNDYEDLNDNIYDKNKDNIKIINNIDEINNKENNSENNNSEENENSEEENIDDLLKEVDETINKSI